MHLSKQIHPKRKVLSVFSLVMINVIAVDSLRNLTIGAEFGAALVSYYLLATLIFFIPIALISAELATGWPKIGGLYVWVREAFGKRWGFVAIWLQWIYNIVWFPTILTFIAATMAYLVDPALAENNTFLLSTILIVFWATTIINCFGMKASSFLSTIGAIFGTILPMFMIICLAIIWLVQGNPVAVDLSWQNMLLPKIDSFSEIAFFSAIIFGLLGIEMSAVHAEEVKNPQRDYPRALLYSGSIIVLSLIFASLAIAIVLPHQKINLISGLIEAFNQFFIAFNMPWMTKVMAVSIIVGAISSVSAWTIGPIKGLLAASEDGCLPSFLCYTSEKGAPIVLLLLQAIIFTLLCSVFVLMPNINASYWILSALTAQLAMLVYLFLFASGIRLRYKKPDLDRAFKIPGGNLVMWLVAGLGIFACLLAFTIGFIPPAEIEIKSLLFYESFLVTGIVVFCAIPLLCSRGKRS